MIDFNNTALAFATKSDSELKMAYMLFLAMKNKTVVSFTKGLTGFTATLGLPLGWAVKPTLYRHFVAGETLDESKKVIKKLREHNIYSVPDYSAEGGGKLEDIQTAFNETRRAISLAVNEPAIAFTVFKPSALIAGKVLEELSSENPELDEIEKSEYANFRSRVLSLCEAAHKSGVKIMIDAEHYAFQKYVDQVAEEAMELYNKERAIVFHTLQMYRTDRLDYLMMIHKKAKERGYVPGIKFVRGAYMEQERQRAFELGYPDPIHPDKDATDRCYNDGLGYVMENISDFELFSGTHNYESNNLLAGLIHEKGLERSDKRIFFSQLYGMSDNISFVLASEGYNVCKYLPYAPVNKVLPYLLRRAEENTSVAGQTNRELSLIKTELERRKMEKQ
ncbi:MAG: proline dehydrogenase family protein [Bacteroidales bacterium]|nr:proline dehydrogenase family protein [Bacteroidales bacterium]MDD3990467.1 proline dehydrogenase family protein [Bacteroidales bacterium]